MLPHRILSPDADVHKHRQSKDLGEGAGSAGHYLAIDTCKNDTDLSAVVSVWPDLPTAIRARVPAMVRAALKGGGR